MRHIPRIFVSDQLEQSAQISLNAEQSHYLQKVMRAKISDTVLLFNGRNGEWRAEIFELDRKKCNLNCIAQVREQSPLPDIDLAFAPVKRSRLEFIVEKATEMGVRNIWPVTTEFTNQKNVRTDRLQKIIIEAAEQTMRMDVPQILPIQTFADWLDQFDRKRTLVFCDEAGEGVAPILQVVKKIQAAKQGGGVTLLIGPEGGFSNAERAFLRKNKNVASASLGPRILRADTAVVAGLTILQAQLGDWHSHFDEQG